MPFPKHVFRHTPVLRNLVTAPDASEMRISYQKFAEMDARAEEEKWPPGWRLPHDVREANRHSVLAERMSEDLWVFAYGSLIWDPAVAVEEYRFAALEGWQRRFCMHLEGGRATRDRPGLMAALDEGGRCDGIVFRIPAALVDTEADFMWRREMFSGAYRPIFLDVDTPQGVVNALTFVMDQSNPRYRPDISKAEAARMIAIAEGDIGPNFEYLDRLVENLHAMSIEDEDMRALRDKAATIRVGRI
ncbi:MAG: gamma-glutamylcyclotransferase [Pikeienuella sp.]